MIPLILAAYIGYAVNAPGWFWLLYAVEAAAVVHKLIQDWYKEE